MKKNIPYKEGDKVFAKLKGYPAWPAKVISHKGRTFSVQFYGTGEMGSIKAENLFYYIKYKHRFGKPTKRKDFNDALAEIESAIQAEGGTDGNPDDDSQIDNSTLDSSGNQQGNRKRTLSDASVDSLQSVKKKPRFGSSLSRESSDQNPSTSDDVTKSSFLHEDDIEEITEEIEEKDEIPDEANEAEEKQRPESPEKEQTPEYSTEIKISSENDLSAYISYAEHVKENENLYKSKKIDVRDHHLPNQVLPVCLPSGKFEGLKLHPKWPLPAFSNEYECALFDAETAEKAIDLKKSIESGNITLESNPEFFVENFSLTEAEIMVETKSKILNHKSRLLERLKGEAKLVKLNSKMIGCLGLKKADPKKATNYIKELQECHMDEVMLKKHHHVVEMMRRVVKYIGNIDEWELDESALKQFQIDASELRKEAEKVCQKFAEVVKLPEGVTNFWNGFNELLNKFNTETENFSKEDLYGLCAEPNSRQAFMDKLLQKELSQTTAKPIETEKENSSEVANIENAEMIVDEKPV